MKRSFNPKAAQTALRSVLGSLIAACAFLVLLPISHHERGWLILARSVIFLAIFALGFYIAYMANRALENGSDLWKQEDIDSLRALLHSRWFMALHLALFLAFVIFALPWSRHWPFRIDSWAFFILGQNLAQLSYATRRQPSSADRKPTWSNLAPLRSNHWGEP